MIVRTIGAIAALALTGPVLADLHHDQVDQTGWYYLTNVDAARVGELLDEGNRLVDLEIQQADPIRFNVVAVPDSGAYATGWWWYHDATATQVDALLAQNDARLIDLEPYQSPSGQRFAVVMKPAGGVDAVAETDWVTDLTFNGVVDWVAENPGRRIHDIETYETPAGGIRYALTWISNTGSDASGWWYYLNTNLDFIEARLAGNDARLVDIERHANGNWSVVMVPNDGNEWWWFTGVGVLDAFDKAASFAGRVVDLERYPTSNGDRLAIVVRRNANDLTLAANAEIRDGIGNDATSGLYCTELDGPFIAGTNTSRAFEPASLMKTFHHYTAMRFVSVGWDALSNDISYPRPPAGNGSSRPCEADGTWLIVTETLQQALVRMMRQSDNHATEAIANRYTTTAIEDLAAEVGAEDTVLNHVIGCFCDFDRSETTLRDVADVHAAVAGGILGSFEDEFHDIMWNSLLGSILSSELAASGLDPADVTAFSDRALTATKDGAYTCSDPSRAHRSNGGYFRIPERREDCSIVDREYFIGAWINDAPGSTGPTAGQNVIDGIGVVYRDRIKAAIATWIATACEETCTGDFNGDGLVDGSDIGLLLSEWGPCTTPCIADLDEDGDVDGGDLGIFLANWGACS